MINTRLMDRLFSATEEENEQITEQVGADIEAARRDGEVDTEELKYENAGDGKVAITDKENGEVTIAERNEDGSYALYPGDVTAQIEGFIHPEGDGVTPGQQVGTPDEHAEEHLDGREISEEVPAEEVCPECGKTPCECEKEDEKEFSVTTDNTVVQKIFSDQMFYDRLFSEVIESEETAKVGDIKVEKDPEDENAVIVTSESTGDQAKVVLDDDTMEVTELESKNFSESFEGLHVVGLDMINHQLIDSTVYSEEAAEDLVARLQEVGIMGIAVFDNAEEARDHAFELFDQLGVEKEEDIDEPEEVEFSDYSVYCTKFYSEVADNMTSYMVRLFSEEAESEEIEKAIENGEQVENDTEIITPIDEHVAIIEDKENGEFTKAVMDEEKLDVNPISEDEANELLKDVEIEEEEKEDEKEFSVYTNDAETRFFSENEVMTSYMVRLFSEDADQELIENALESGEVVDTEMEVITPIDDHTAIIEDKENGEFTKAELMDDEYMDVQPMDDEAAKEAIENLAAEAHEPEVKEEEVKEEEPAAKEEEKEEEKEYSTLDRWFADTVVAPVQAAPQAQVVAAPAQGEVVEEPVDTVEAIEDKALAAVQSIKAAAEEASAAILNAKAAPVENTEADLQEAQFSEKTFSDTTLVSWLTGNSNF